MQACLNIQLNMHAWVSATDARWQCRQQCIVSRSGPNIALEHGNRRERKERVLFASLRPTETFMRACSRPTEAACLHVRKCVNKSQLIVAGIHRFFRYTYAYAARFRMRIYTQNAACATYTYANTDWHFLVHGNGHTHACLTQGWNLLYFDGCHLETIVAN